MRSANNKFKQRLQPVTSLWHQLLGDIYVLEGKTSGNFVTEAEAGRAVLLEEGQGEKYIYGAALAACIGRW